jgi:hypothetical protein
MAVAIKAKPTEMSDDVKSMVDLRHSAEQRGHYSPLGRLLSAITQHGTIVWPSERGEGVGPDLAIASPVDQIENPDAGWQAWADAFLVLGQWLGLPALRRNSNLPCPRCRHACDICDGSGKKQCEGLGCGGTGLVSSGPMECTGPDCAAQTGKFKADCVKCGGTGQLTKLTTCAMCCGSGKMTCSRCRGTAMFSTGRVDGSLDYQLPACRACGGTQWKGKFERQDPAKFTNAMLATSGQQPNGNGYRQVPRYLALGPIQSFVIQDFQTSKPRQFEVSADEKGDLLFLLVPASPRQKPQKAYLVGGVVREREGARGAA